MNGYSFIDRRRKLMRKIGMAVGLFVMAFPVIAAAQSTPTVKRTPAKYTSPTSGKEMFQQYCTPCHGPNGKGNGPAASAMRVPPADLTRLAAKYKGVFPDMEVAEALRAGPTPSNASAHGSETMPVWGPVFASLNGRSDTAMAELRIHNLVEYVRTIQEK
jgi:mono/diheme cytochrome c family protein